MSTKIQKFTIFVAAFFMCANSASAQFISTYRNNEYSNLLESSKQVVKLQVFSEMSLPTEGWDKKEIALYNTQNRQRVFRWNYTNVRTNYFIKPNIELMLEFDFHARNLLYGGARFIAVSNDEHEFSILAGTFKTEHSDIYPGPDSLRMSEVPITGMGFDDGVLGLGAQYLRGDFIFRGEIYDKSNQFRTLKTRTGEFSARYSTVSVFYNTTIGYGAFVGTPWQTWYCSPSAGWTRYKFGKEDVYFVRNDILLSKKIRISTMYNYIEDDEYWLLGGTYEYLRGSFMKLYYSTKDNKLHASAGFNVDFTAF